MREADSSPVNWTTALRRWSAAVAVTFLMIGLALLVWHALPYLLILFAGLLVAVLFDALASFVERYTKLRRGWSLAVVAVVVVGAVAGIGIWMGPRISSQTTDLAQQLPLAWDRLREMLERQSWFQWLGRQMPAPSAVAWRAGLGSRVGGYAWGTLDFIIDLAVILFFGLFVAARPSVYAGGLLLLVAPRARLRVRQVLIDVATALRWWLLGRIVSMTIIGVLDGIGLWALGVPLPIMLGIIAGVLTFLPNVGPVLSAIPAVLLALTRPEHAWLPVWVIVLKLAVQTVESYAITPLVQRRALSLPPATTLGVQFVLGAIAGLPGLALAVPLTAVSMVLTRRLYVEDILCDPVGPTPQK